METGRPIRIRQKGLSLRNLYRRISYLTKQIGTIFCENVATDSLSDLWVSRKFEKNLDEAGRTDRDGSGIFLGFPTFCARSEPGLRVRPDEFRSRA